ncbi:hypothetical protein N7474_000114 [Penicillium riverlandense]|uniref:uncharacterized protein n=1 Tax=Penicillium riverlandense TaxID=1903569 RepID=UPI0025490C58|nr:uncharacterized protein N7474_000114 [Penicillium riverlandense]KAJ5831803.1 hypothetical protein N7474_000114 [Penicillium riverlandense]
MGPTLPSQRRAIVKESPGQAVITSVPMPDVPPGYMLVQTQYVALNPADWTDIDGDEYIGCVVGLDYAGTVVQVGKQVNRTFEPGDRVAGISHGCNVLHPDYGGFSEYILVKADAQMKVPKTMNLEDAASMGVGVITASMGLYQQIGLPLSSLENVSNNDSEWILIYGGSSATGSLAIQFAKLSGLKVVTTCSPRNFDLVRDMGADIWFDYRDPNISSLIASATSNTLIYALDAIATDETAAICVASFMNPAVARSTVPPKAIYACTLDPSLPLSTSTPVEKKFFLGYTFSGEEFLFEGARFPPILEDHQFIIKIMELAEQLIREGKLKNHPLTLNLDGKGFEGVLKGLDCLREGKVSGRKLVYSVYEKEDRGYEKT